MVALTAVLVLAGLAATAALGFQLVSRTARAQALVEEARSAVTLGSVVFAAALPGAVAGDAGSIQALDSAIRRGAGSNDIVRVKVWRRDGSIAYSDDHSIIGRRFPVKDDIRDAIDAQRATTGVSLLRDAENVDERPAYKQLAEVYTPLALTDGSHVALEMYFTDARMAAAQSRALQRLWPFALAALLVFAAAQVPVPFWLLSRLRAARGEGRAARTALRSSDRERQAVAMRLHSGTVQELSAGQLALQAALRQIPARAPRQLLEIASLGVGNALAEVLDIAGALHPEDISAARL